MHEVGGHGYGEGIGKEGMECCGWCRFAGGYLRFTALGSVALGPCVGLGYKYLRGEGSVCGGDRGCGSAGETGMSVSPMMPLDQACVCSVRFCDARADPLLWRP